MANDPARVGKTALDLTRSSTPDDLRAEAYWWTQADGTRGTTVMYDGQEHGIHYWRSGTSRMMLRSQPKNMSPEDEAELKWQMAKYYERERERMLDEVDQREGFSYDDWNSL